MKYTKRDWAQINRRLNELAGIVEENVRNSPVADTEAVNIGLGENVQRIIREVADLDSLRETTRPDQFSSGKAQVSNFLRDHCNVSLRK
jgi:hypothetical protein